MENLLSVTRIAPGEKARLNKVSAALEEIIESALMKFRKQYPQVAVEVSLPEEALFSPVDELLLEQVLSNLLENAVLHGEITTTIRISLYRQASNACICVEDDGKGLSLRRLENLWSGRLENETKGDSRRNMGIGLSVCRTVMEAHGGTIRGENRKEGGARFILTLPMEEEHGEDQG